jgi:hypothetical protein
MPAARKRSSEEVTIASQNHALEFLLPVDPRYGIRSIAKRIWHAAATDENIAARFAAIQESMGSGKPLISEAQYDLYQRLKHGLPPLDIPTAPEWIRPAFAAAYLRAKAIVSGGQVRGLLEDIDGRLQTVQKLVSQVESPFVGDLLVETMLAASEDSEFGRTLKKGADEFRALSSDLYGPEGTDRPDALARAAAGGGGDCVCCRDGDCAPCSCWIIVIIIIIIIVTK